MSTLKVQFDAETNNFHKKLRNAKKDIADFKKGAQKAGASVSGITQNFQKIGGLTTGIAGDMGGIVSTLGRMGVIGGALATIIGVISAGISQSQTLTDSWGRAWDGVKAKAGALGIAFGKLMNGDFKGFTDILLSDTGTIIDKEASKLYDITDALGTFQNEALGGLSTLTAEMARQKAIITDISKSENERLEAQKKLDTLTAEYITANNKIAEKQEESYHQLIRLQVAKNAIKFTDEELLTIEKQLRTVGGTDALVAMGGKFKSFADSISDETHQQINNAYKEWQTTLQQNEELIRANNKISQKTIEKPQKAQKVDISVAGSRGAITKAIQAIQKQMDNDVVFMSPEWKDLDKAKQKLEAQLQPKLTIEPSDNSIASLQKKVDDVTGNAQVRLSLSEVGTLEYYEALKDLQDNEKNKIAVDFIADPNSLKDAEILLNEAIDNESLSSMERLNDSLIEMKNHLTDVKSGLLALGQPIPEELTNSLERITTKSNDTANAIDLLKRTQESTQEASNNQFESLTNLSNAMNELATATGASEDSFIGLTARFLSGISQIIPALMQMIAVQQGEAVAGATASGAKMPFPLNIVAIATGVATVLAQFAKIGKFANGGIVGGSSNYGDMQLARVNSGEMILNRTQQGNLFRLLNNGGGMANNTTTTTRIEGRDLVLVTRNYNNSNRKLK